MAQTAIVHSPAAIEQEWARRSLLSFARYVNPVQGCAPSVVHSSYQTPRHIEELAEHLEAVERGDITRLMILEPRRHGKSRFGSQIFPCWYLGRNPEREVFQTGNADKIATYNSRKARDIFASDEFSQVFPDVHHRPARPGQEIIAIPRQAAHEWGTTDGGMYRATGVLGQVTGFGADLLIIDDPMKGREAAQSLTIRDKIWEQYTGVLYPILSPWGAILLIMTRWHPDDLGGKCLKEMAEGTGDDWTVLSLPAINEAGEALWPERWSIKALRRIEKAIGPYEWAAQYQQEPTLRGGNMFNMDRVQIHVDVDAFPDTSYIRFWDLASSEKERAKSDPDYTVGALVGVTIGGIVPHVWLKDVVRIQREAPARDALIRATAERDGPAVRIAVESVAGYKDAYTTLSGALKGLRTVIKVNVSADKVVRAAPVEPVIEAGNFHMLKADWNNPTLAEGRDFPAGKHDDIWDSIFGGMAQAVKYAGPGTANPYDMEWWEGRNRYDYDTRKWRNAAVSRWQFWGIAASGIDEPAEGQNLFTVKVSFELAANKRIAVSDVLKSEVRGVDVPALIVSEAARENHDAKLARIVIDTSPAGDAAIDAISQRLDWVSELMLAFDLSGFGDRLDRPARTALWCRRGSVLIPHPCPSAPWAEELAHDLEFWPDVANLDLIDGFAAGVIYLEHELAEGWRKRARPD